MTDTYVPYHLHTDISNLTAGTGADCVTKFTQYLDVAKQYGMQAFAFSEHGSTIHWMKKKSEVENRGMKYIHANEVYLTEHIDKEKGLIRDNYHYMLIAKNFDGVKELNLLTSNSFNKKDGHYYYNPRISFEELMNTSDNIIMTSACLASPLWKLYNKAYDQTMGNFVDKEAKRKLDMLIEFMSKNKHRMFLEVQYHEHPEQIKFNQMLLSMSKELNIPLIAGTDTHALNMEHQKTRQLYLKTKGASYGDEDKFDLTFKSYEELVTMFKKQDALPKDVYLEAIHNTNVMADMVEEFVVDATPKYPKLYEKPIEVFKQKINEGVVKRGINSLPSDKRKAYFDRIREEFDTYVKLDAVDYMLLQENIIDWCHKNDIYQGYGRGSVNGSLIAYVLGITEMDSIKHRLNFFRFLNPERISLPDIDIDFEPSRRQDVIDYVSSIEGIDFAEIITLNTFALKGSIRAVGKGLGMDLNLVDEIAKEVRKEGKDDVIDESYRTKYPELFKYVDTLVGATVSMGSHPSGFIVSPVDLKTNVGTLFTDKSTYKVTCVNMKELDAKNYVKLDMLGLDNIELINKTCSAANIPRLTPDNVDIDDVDVWKSLRESTLGVFQWESDSAQAYVKMLFSDSTLENIKENVGDVSYIDLLSIGNAAIRPSGEPYRYDLAKGITKDNGHPALNNLLKDSMSYLVYQEQIMRFLTDFCEHTGAESDSVRRGLAKKEGTEQFLPKIEKGFIHHMVNKYGESEEHAKELLQSFLDVIKAASSYGFSVNHSQPYSYIGYIGAYLRHYYPLEFLSTILNLNGDDLEKTNKIASYASQKGIEIKPIKFGKSKSMYSFDKNEYAIYKGIASIKDMNAKVADNLYSLSQQKEYTSFIDLLIDIANESIANKTHMETLIKLDYFSQFGHREHLLTIYNTFKEGKGLFYKKDHSDKTKTKRIELLHDFERDTLTSPVPKVDIFEQISFEKDVLGYAVTVFPDVDEDIYIVTDVNKKFKPKVTLYQLQSGKEESYKVEKKKFYTEEDDLLYVGDVIRVLDYSIKNGWKHVDGKFEVDDSKKEAHLEKVKIIRKSSKRG